MTALNKQALRETNSKPVKRIDIGIDEYTWLPIEKACPEGKYVLHSDYLALLDELEAENELVELQRFKLERQEEDLHQAKSLESIHREKRLEVEREFRDYKERAESNQMRLAKEVCRLEDELKAAGIGVKGE